MKLTEDDKKLILKALNLYIKSIELITDMPNAKEAVRARKIYDYMWWHSADVIKSVLDKVTLTELLAIRQNVTEQINLLNEETHDEETHNEKTSVLL